MKVYIYNGYTKELIRTEERDTAIMSQKALCGEPWWFNEEWYCVEPLV